MRMYLFHCVVFLITGSLAASGFAQTCNDNISASTHYGQFIVDKTNGVVTDERTGLMWKRCLEGQDGTDCSGTTTAYTWEGALQRPGAVNTGGGFATYTDWRLPNAKELATIVEKQCQNPATNLWVFPKTSSSHDLWSSTPEIEKKDAAYGLKASTGNITDQLIRDTDDSTYVRLVRDAS